jgi:hypothetical protein
METNEAVLETVSVPIDDIQPHPDNPRVGDMDTVKESLQEHGQYRAIVVDSNTKYILAGNHTWRGAKELGWPTILVHWVTPANATAAKKLLLVDNRSSDLSVYDNEKLMPLIEEMMLSGELRGTGYNAEQVDDMMAEMDKVVVDVDFEGDFRESPEDTASRYREPTAVVPQRQFVLMYPEGPESERVEKNIAKLKKAWGLKGTAQIVAEALFRCSEVCNENEGVVCACLQVAKPE